MAGDLTRSLLTVGEFLENHNSDVFLNVLKLYNTAIDVKASSRVKKSNLPELDVWFQSELPAALKSRRDSPHLLHSELVKLMEWKLSRGKFRPRLVDLAASNTNELVKQVTTEGLKLAKENEPSRALAVLCKLRGVGPATASAILAAAAPDKYVFFADEVAHAALGTTSLKYSEAEYLKLNDVIIEAANQINKEQAMNESEGTCIERKFWTPHDVERTVWCYAILRQNKPELLVKALITSKKTQT